ncbi:MAG: DUF1292 domain-containing protein [Clostridia bacterium]|nr:DUF1292 domain-containing protein [Clostridia bacterium]
MMDNYITLQLLADDGSPIEQECMIIGVFDVDGQDYIALAPTDDTETVLIYGYRPAGEEQFELFEIEEEDTYIKVVAEFNQIISEE